MLRALPVVLVLSLLSLALAVPAHAVLITVNFTVTPSIGPAAGIPATGTFSFDSSIIPVGGGVVPALDPSGLNFVLTGTTWTDANATLTNLTFDAAGNLTSFTLYGDPNGPAISSIQDAPDDFGFTGHSGFTYHDQGVAGVAIGGSITWTTTTSGSAPEPASWLLFGGALVGLVGVRRRARK